MVPASIHRASICDLYKRAPSIIKRLRIPRSTVYDAISRFKDVGTLKDRTGRGRPSTVTTSPKVKIVRDRIRRNAHRSIRKMASDLGMSRTSMTTIVRKTRGLTPYRVRRAAILSETNKQKRCQKAKLLLARARVGEHLMTMFSDEKLFTVETEFNSQNHRVLAKDSQGAVEKGRTIHRVSHPASVMVFGAVCATGKCPLVFVEKGVKINKDVYVEEILKKHLLLWAQITSEDSAGYSNKTMHLPTKRSSLRSCARSTCPRSSSPTNGLLHRRT